MTRRLGMAVMTVLALLVTGGTVGAADEIALTIEKNRFSPEEIKVKAGTPFVLVVTNKDAGPEEFESKDLRINSETTLIAPLSAHVGMKLSYLVRFDNLPALNAAGTAPLRKTDRILSSGIQISF